MQLQLFILLVLQEVMLLQKTRYVQGVGHRSQATASVAGHGSVAVCFRLSLGSSKSRVNWSRLSPGARGGLERGGSNGVGDVIEARFDEIQKRCLDRH